MVSGNQFYVIDWDQCGLGPYWFDLLSLITHPHLRFNKTSRYQLFKQCCSLNLAQSEAIFHAFCQYKIKQLSSLAVLNNKFDQLVKQYQISSREFQN